MTLRGERYGVKPGALVGDDRPRSEADAWMIARDRARRIKELTPRGEAFDQADLIEILCDQMIAQLRRGVHANPGELAVVALGNPPGEVFGSDVLGIVYQHEDDRAGDVRVHLFGKGGEWRETRRGRGVELYNLPSATGVYMMAQGDKRVVMQHRRGLPLVQEF